MITRLSLVCEQYVPVWCTTTGQQPDTLCHRHSAYVIEGKTVPERGQSEGKSRPQTQVSCMMLARFFYNVTSADATREHPCENGGPGHRSHALLPSSERRRLVRTSGSSVGMLGRASVVGELGALLAARDSRLERSNSSFSFLLKKPHL